MLGSAYAFAQNLIWASVKLVSPPHLLNICSGLIGTGLNILPSFIPLLLFTGDTRVDLTTLAAFGALGVVAYALAARESIAIAAARTNQPDEMAKAADAAQEGTVT